MTVLTIEKQGIAKDSATLRREGIAKVYHMGVTARPKALINILALVDTNRKRPTITGSPNRIENGLAYAGSRIAMLDHGMNVRTRIGLLKDFIGMEKMAWGKTGHRVHLWNAMHMAEQMLDLAINRQRALRRQSINIESLEMAADKEIHNLSVLLFTGDWD